MRRCRYGTLWPWAQAWVCSSIHWEWKCWADRRDRRRVSYSPWTIERSWRRASPLPCSYCSGWNPYPRNQIPPHTLDLKSHKRRRPLQNWRRSERKGFNSHGMLSCVLKPIRFYFKREIFVYETGGKSSISLEVPFNYGKYGILSFGWEKLWKERDLK